MGPCGRHGCSGNAGEGCCARLPATPATRANRLRGNILRGVLVSSWALLAAEAELFEELGCTEHSYDGHDGWIWSPGTGEWPSCSGALRGDGASMCIGPDGKPDPTSIRVNMNHVDDKTGCFVWEASECSLDLRTISRLEFDFELSPECSEVWSAPLWMAPDPWEPPAGLSGEIDFIENCPMGQMSTNFAGCIGTDEGQCQQLVWPGNWLQGAKHFVMTLDDSMDLSAKGTLRTYVCDLGGENCEKAAVYHSFLSSVVATKDHEQSYSYTLRSDIWNGDGGDTGWYMCGGKTNHHTGCEYAIRNIRVTSDSDAPHALDGICAALNEPVPGRPPAPAAAEPTSSSCSAFACGAYVPTQSCQCNQECAKHSNCCPDYESVCIELLADNAGGRERRHTVKHGVLVALACLVPLALAIGGVVLALRYKDGLSSHTPTFVQRLSARAAEPIVRFTSGNVEMAPLVQRDRGGSGGSEDETRRGVGCLPNRSRAESKSSISDLLGVWGSQAGSPTRRAPANA